MFMQNVPDQVATNGIAKSESRLRRTWSNCEQVHPNSAVAICEIRKLTLFKRLLLLTSSSCCHGSLASQLCPVSLLCCYLMQVPFQ